MPKHIVFKRIGLFLIISILVVNIFLTDLQLTAKATALLSAEQQKRNMAKEEELTASITSKTNKITEITNKALSQVATVNELYDNSEIKVENQSVKNGFAHSNVIIDKLAQMETERNNKIAEINAKRDSEIATLQAEISEETLKLNNVSTYYSELSSEEINAKVIELKDKQDEILRNVFKYNSALSEKEDRYANSIAESLASFQLRFMEISSNYFTKDQLIEMGYYTDVLNCINGYYSRLTPSSAFNDIKAESRLMIYLDDYYQDVVYLYKTRAQ